MYINEREQKFFSQSKRERILYLGRMGFNIPKFLGTLSSIKELAVFFKDKIGSRVSIRTQNKVKPILGPHLPFVLVDKKLIKGLQTNIRKGYELLIFEPINPKDALKRGMLWVNKSEGKVGIEYMDSPGTVRELEKELGLKKVDMSIEDLLNKEKDNNEFLGYPPSKFVNLPFSQFIIEFSIYDHPVGTQLKNEIFWEIRQL